VPKGLRQFSMFIEADTIVVKIVGTQLQPVFLRGGRDTITMDYTIESVLFKSSSGSILNGWMIKPKNKTVTTTLLHLHGNSGFIYTQYHAILPMVSLGYQVFVFDYSGYGFSTGKATRGNILNDAKTAIDYVKSRDDVKNTKLVLYGQSLGGHLSAVAASMRKNDLDALVIEGAFSSHKDIAAKMGGVLARWIVSEKYCGYKALKSFSKPTLIIHSSEDEVIPFEQGQKLFNSANEPKTFYEIKQCHLCGPRYYAEDIDHKIKALLLQ